MQGILLLFLKEMMQPGGLLRYGIPDFKLEKWVVERRIKLMEEEGIVFKCNANVGVNISINDLAERISCHCISRRFHHSQGFEYSGKGIKRNSFCHGFFKTAKSRELLNKEVNGEDIFATGKNVVVIGGGDTGSDCVGTSNRHKAKSVTQFELLPKPPESTYDLYALAHLSDDFKNYQFA